MSVLDRRSCRRRVRRLREEGKTVVFTNGCFDLLHRGHVHLLRRASQQGDHLVVAVNSDASVRRLKGEGRPILPEEDRCVLMDALEFVDDVVVFEEDTPMELIEELAPDVLVKGADYEADEIVGAERVQKRGGRVHRVPLLEGQGTSRIVESIREGGGEREG